MFAGWGKKFGSTCDLAKSSLFGKSYATYALFPCKNLPQLIDLSTFALQNHPFGQICSLKVQKLLQFTRLYWGKILFEDFASCKRIDILQLWQRPLPKHFKLLKEGLFLNCGWVGVNSPKLFLVKIQFDIYMAYLTIQAYYLS